MSRPWNWRDTGVVDASNVMRANAKTARTFSGHVVGKYERTGPNSWDPYKLVAQDGPDAEVPPGLRIQIEDTGVRFRVRAFGAVHVVEWRPDATVLDEDPAQLRKRFLETYVTEFDHKPGIGAAAFIAKTLR